MRVVTQVALTAPESHGYPHLSRKEHNAILPVRADFSDGFVSPDPERPRQTSGHN
jgi:hypothetical protein